MIQKDKVDLARANLLKTVRAAVRLRHSIQADIELNDLLPEVEAKFNKAVLRGVLPDPVDIKKSLGL